MQYINFIIFCVLLSLNSFAKLEEIKTKQAINNIRYISLDGKLTYFKNQSGELKFSHNYSLQTLIKGAAYDNYIITPSANQKMIAIEKQSNPHRKNWFFNENDIYISKTASKTVQKIAKGIVPRFHQDEKFLTYYRPSKSEIVIYNLTTNKIQSQIKITNPKNPFFIPQVHMITPNDVVYTDINSKGQSAVLMYSTFDKKFETIYKSLEASKKLELCIKGDTAIIGEFPYDTLGRNSSLMKVKLFNNQNFQNIDIIYSSPFADLGNMICQDDSIYFIKVSEYQSKIQYKKTEVALFDLKTEVAKIITSLGDVTQITQIGEMILTPYKGRILVVKGKNKFIDDSIRRTKP